MYVSYIFSWSLSLRKSTPRWALSEKKSCQDNLRAVTGYLGELIGGVPEYCKSAITEPIFKKEGKEDRFVSLAFLEKSWSK